MSLDSFQELVRGLDILEEKQPVLLSDLIFRAQKNLKQSSAEIGSAFERFDSIASTE